MQADDGPLAPLLERFDPSADGNVIDGFRELITTTAVAATKRAVQDLTESNQESVERLTKALTSLERVAAVEEARLAESQRGTAKGNDHERTTEELLGELVSVAGDSLDDVSTSTGVTGSKRGDKVVTPKGGIRIAVEDKATARQTEAKARLLLEEAMSNRDAGLAMLIVDDIAKVPGGQPYHLIDDNKVVVVAEPLPLRLVYCLFRAKAIELATVNREVGTETVSDGLRTIQDLVGEIRRSLDRFRLMRTEHTKIEKSVTQAARYVDESELSIADAVGRIVKVIDGIVGEGSKEAA